MGQAHNSSLLLTLNSIYGTEECSNSCIAPSILKMILQIKKAERLSPAEPNTHLLATFSVALSRLHFI